MMPLKLEGFRISLCVKKKCHWTEISQVLRRIVSQKYRKANTDKASEKTMITIYRQNQNYLPYLTSKKTRRVSSRTKPYAAQHGGISPLTAGKNHWFKNITGREH